MVELWQPQKKKTPYGLHIIDPRIALKLDGAFIDAVNQKGKRCALLLAAKSD